MSNTADVWFARFRSSPSPRARLICFPFAGGSSTIFRRWHLFLPDWVDVCAVELPGRGRRFQEAPLTEIDTVVKAVASEIKAMSSVNCFLFGHSLGALIAFATARMLNQNGLSFVRHLFVSGRCAPHLGNPDQEIGRASCRE